ncbi:MAG: 3D domain-containing protein, partial [Hungatella sp.]
MKKKKLFGLSTLFTTMLCCLAVAMPAWAATLTGQIDTVDSTQITGWAWNSSDTNEILSIELHIYKEDTDIELAGTTIKADHYRDDLHVTLDDGYHAFQYQPEWSKLDGDSFDIKAYAISREGRFPLTGPSTYHKPGNQPSTAANASTEQTSASSTETTKNGPGVINPPATAATANAADTAPVTVNGKKGSSLGQFTTTGYCNCSRCSGGHNLTFSGTVPKAAHTISADLGVLPIGTKVMINDVVYTVEDMGAGVD